MFRIASPVACVATCLVCLVLAGPISLSASQKLSLLGADPPGGLAAPCNTKELKDEPCGPSGASPCGKFYKVCRSANKTLTPPERNITMCVHDETNMICEGDFDCNSHWTDTTNTQPPPLAEPCTPN